MKTWMIISALVSAFALPAIPAPAVAPEMSGKLPELAYYPMGESGFSFRWTPNETSGPQQCQNYGQCAFGDILGPTCPAEVFVAIEFYDEKGDYVSDGGDIIVGNRKQRHMNVEVGTNRDVAFDTFNVTDIFCGEGLPTGKGRV
ncbi:MAG: hypothetical protein ACKOWI_05210 [Rhodoluna sp.]